MPAYRRPHSIVSYWHEGSLVVEDFLEGEPVKAGREVVRVLDACNDWTEAEAIAATVPELPADDVLTALEDLRACGLLLRDDDDDSADAAVARHWGIWSIEAAFAHFATKDAPYIEDAADERDAVEAIARADAGGHTGSSTVSPCPSRRSRRSWRRHSAPCGSSTPSRRP